VRRPNLANALPYAAAALAGLVLWQALRDRPAVSAGAAATVTASKGHAQSASPASSVASFPALPGSSLSPRPSPAAQPPGAAATAEVVVGRNDTLDAIFRRIALNPADLAAIRQLPGIRASLDFLKPGDAIRLTHSGGALEELSRKVSETQTLRVIRDAAPDAAHPFAALSSTARLVAARPFVAHLIDNPVQAKIRTASATIDSSLFQAAESAQISDGVALKLANVFAWDIDFVLDIRDGDRFTAVYQQIYQDGRYLRDGELLAAEFINDGKVYRAVRFVNDAGVAGYYAPDGKPMRKAFLRAPVEFTRVSSVFNPHRLHPILNLIRGHMGTDYAAPIGTPVHAAGEGRVSFAGTRGGYGNAVVLAHTSGISTLYGHMSRFARNLRVGSHVQQGDVIGYVGMTGLATGPHLHYEYLLNGVHEDPQTVKLPGAEPLRADAMGKFRLETAGWLAELAAPHPAAPAAAAATAPSSSSLSRRLAAAGVSQYLGEPRASID
jgi:murein DD-endopeptidase MepM/ murein hydrolase activator NlpD